ncbi:MAG TPA: thiamine phosphate synthase [Phycisphaerales bacterium]|nr:thiamine phosphate synthase [Phycisphaerales bacterium]
MADSPATDHFRILDAAANRGREAFRVLEDAARFLLEDPVLTEAAKRLRHDLVSAVKELPSGKLRDQRSVVSDPGCSISLDTERQRPDALAVVQAAAGRATEALRSLEEWSKPVSGALSHRFETMRYATYDFTGTLVQRLERPKIDWRVCLLLTESSCRLNYDEVLRAAIRGGVDCIQVREKTLTDLQLRDRVRHVIDHARPAGVAVVVNDRIDVALSSDADGVHLGQDDLGLDDARRIAGSRLLLGRTTHDPEELEDAVAGGADVVGVGAMFPSSTKSEVAPEGRVLLDHLLQHHPGQPHLAIGGLDASRARTLAQRGCRGVAVCAEICGADDPESSMRAFVDAMRPVGAGAVGE